MSGVRVSEVLILLTVLCQTRFVKILITGGGTGGHVAPAMAVIDALRFDYPDVDLLYVGSSTGIEARLASEAGVRFVSIAAGKLRRSSNPVKMINPQNLRDLLRIPVGVLQAFKVVRAFGPDAVLSTGGYVCVPTVLAATLLRVPVLTHEQTVTVGLANRIAGRFAKRIALTFPQSKELLSKRSAAKSEVTGNPLRQQLFAGSRDNAARFGFVPGDDLLPCVFVTGGAQGARVINRAIAAATPTLLKSARILHQCGTLDVEELRTARENLDPQLAQRWQLRTFIESDEIGDAWAISDVLIARAGAGTVTEACALAKPAVYVPLEPTSGEEQLKNAERSVAGGGAFIVRQAECSAESIIAAVQPLLESLELRRRMGAANGALAMPNAAPVLAKMLINLSQPRVR
jgi:UDP-N-acetylglucosamine--N-acetylmuramyl-(pentapeptide) pyrophosphoryl-undecaprenol N-acetylglucosamine transferase